MSSTLLDDPVLPTNVVPVLQPGDQLTQAEFERRYSAMPDCKKAELIEGIVYMASPVRFSRHGQPHFLLNGWLATYLAATPQVQGGDNTTLRLDRDNQPQPDSLLFVAPESGGRVRISDDDYLVGAPEFVAEISAGTVALDRGPKLRTYLRHGVNEYLIWRTEDQVVEWYVLRDDEYVLLTPDVDGLLRSNAFPSLWLHQPALLSGDLTKLIDTVRAGLESPEHASFVARLQTTTR